jgi:hypothetical protein
MPTIAYFYGIMIQMYYDNHEPPHFHARYGRAWRRSSGVIASRPPESGRLGRTHQVERTKGSYNPQARDF